MSSKRISEYGYLRARIAAERRTEPWPEFGASPDPRQAARDGFNMALDLVDDLLFAEEPAEVDPEAVDAEDRIQEPRTSGVFGRRVWPHVYNKHDDCIASVPHHHARPYRLGDWGSNLVSFTDGPETVGNNVEAPE